MPSLNRNTLSSVRRDAEIADPSRSSALPPVRILQIGDGNFLRAFADWMVDVANGAGLMNGRVTIVSPLPQSIVDKLNAQDSLYTVLLRGVQQGKAVESRRVITCVDT
ncbi:MAG TPA: tagaturonate reductase, partial [Rhodocyclaceae bacterium]|nr:tagaturonate reductase [Rhodocyclaceae bacterium]